MNKYSEQLKLEAVEIYLSGTLGLRATAKLHNVGFASLRKWVAGFEALGIAGIQRKRRQAYDVKFKVEVLHKMKSKGNRLANLSITHDFEALTVYRGRSGSVTLQ